MNNSENATVFHGMVSAQISMQVNWALLNSGSDVMVPMERSSNIGQVDVVVKALCIPRNEPTWT